MPLQDEPTNYLDRDALGALASAIKDYGGGVIMISHSSEFTSALCPEKWVVADGRLTIEGQTDAQKEAAKLEWKRQEEMTDAFGNTIKVKAPKKVRLAEPLFPVEDHKFDGWKRAGSGVGCERLCLL